MQGSVEGVQPLKWSHVSTRFDAGDHPDRTMGIGILPLMVSPTINNSRLPRCW